MHDLNIKVITIIANTALTANDRADALDKLADDFEGHAAAEYADECPDVGSAYLAAASDARRSARCLRLPW
jgi:hypothetical protein